MFKNKKAQGEIITTVLIILLVLAAIVIVWNVVGSTVNKAGEQANTASQCVGIPISISGSITNTSATVVKLRIARGNDQSGADGLKVILTNSTGGSVYNDTVSIKSIPSYGSGDVLVGFSAISPGTNTVQIAPKIGSIQCDPATSKNFIAQ